MVVNTQMCSSVFLVPHHIVFCVAILIHMYSCFDVSYFTSKERIDLKGFVCNEETRLFDGITPGVTSCIFECSSNYDCIASIFVEESNQCIGCPCEALRDKSTRTHLNGARFYLHYISTMFEGRCGSIDNITVEYTDNGNYSSKPYPIVNPNIWPIWMPEEEIYFIKIDFNQKRRVNKIKTQGRKYGQVEEYVKTYSVYNSNDCVTKNFLETLAGNKNGKSVAITALSPSVLTRCLYIQPETWHNYPTMRIDLVGY